jgi:hypothetical protein
MLDICAGSIKSAKLQSKSPHLFALIEELASECGNFRDSANLLQILPRAESAEACGCKTKAPQLVAEYICSRWRVRMNE